jgi:hypothetical protein
MVLNIILNGCKCYFARLLRTALSISQFYRLIKCVSSKFVLYFAFVWLVSGSLRSCGRAVAGGTWLMTTWHWIECFLEKGRNKIGDIKTLLVRRITLCQECLAHTFHLQVFYFWSRTDRKEFGILTLKSLKVSVLSPNGVKMIQKFWKKNKNLNFALSDTIYKILDLEDFGRKLRNWIWPFLTRFIKFGIQKILEEK